MAGKQLKTMDVSALLALRAQIDVLLEGKRKELEMQLAAFGSTVGNGGSTAGNGKLAKRVGGKGKRAKAAPQFRSKKNSKVVWSGRGMTPIWMREEMKGTKLKKEDFRIKS